MKADLHVLRVAARTAVGLDAPSSAAAVRAGISRVREHPFMVDGAGAPLLAAYDPVLDPGLFGADRMIALAVAAIAECGVDGDCQVLLALPEARPGFTDADARRVVREVQRRSGIPAELAGRGHAGAFRAMEEAVRRVASGVVCVVGGVDSYLDADTLDWLEKDRRVAREGVRSGFHPGEAAGFLVLGSRRHADRVGSLARLRGVGTAIETRLWSGDEEVLGVGLAAAMTAATEGLDLPREAVDGTFCDINGERYRSTEWTFALLKCQPVFRDVAYTAPANCWGDVGAASGALACVLAAQAWTRGAARGPRALTWASSDGGLRGAALWEVP